jgi:hypothetical protein
MNDILFDKFVKAKKLQLLVKEPEELYMHRFGECRTRQDLLKSPEFMGFCDGYEKKPKKYDLVTGDQRNILYEFTRVLNNLENAVYAMFNSDDEQEKNRKAKEFHDIAMKFKEESFYDLHYIMGDYIRKSDLGK